MSEELLCFFLRTCFPEIGKAQLGHGSQVARASLECLKFMKSLSTVMYCDPIDRSIELVLGPLIG